MARRPIAKITPAQEALLPEARDEWLAAVLSTERADRSRAELLESAQRGELPGRLIANDWRFSRTALLAWLRADQGRDDADASGR